MPNPPTPEQLEAAVKTWNENHPIGTPVRRYSMMSHQPGDEHTTTKTRSAAWIMGGHSPMVNVEGHTGGQHLDQLEVIPEAERQASHIPPPNPAAPPPKRAGAFFLSDVMDTVGQVLQDAEAHGDPQQYIQTVIAELQRPRHRIDPED